jgi:tetratricopeptide (TPR) repeat protein
MAFKMAAKVNVCLLAAIGLLTATVVAQAAVRPVSDTERVAVQTAAAYLSRGPEAVYEQLAPSSPLAKLRKEDALAEIETRLGPPAGATWELQTVVPALKDDTVAFNVSFPSGLDDVAIFEMTKENRVANLRTLAEPSPVALPFPKEIAIAAATAPVETAEGGHFAILLAGILAVVVAVTSAFVRREHTNGAKWMLAVAVILLAGAAFLGLKDDPRLNFAPAKAGPVASAESYRKIGTLLPLRRTLAAGVGDVDAIYRQVAISGFAKDVASLWKAQYDLQELRLPDVDRALQAFPSPSTTPLAEILRGRLAFYQAKEVDAVVAYERAINLGPGRDGLWIETAGALETLGFDERAEGYFKRLAKMGSRNAAVYYSAAMIAAGREHMEDSEEALNTAWTLRPVERANLVQAGVLWNTLRRPKIMEQVQLNAAAEATFASATAGTRAIVLPPDAQPRISGDFLDIHIGQQELEVPGGAGLAPLNTPIVDAGVWARSEQEEALKDFPQLLTIAHRGGAYTQPLLRLQLVRCANALADHNRWNDLLQLTEGVSGKAEHVPSDVILLRDVALQRADRRVDAVGLLGELAQSPVLKRKNSQRLYAEIGMMLAQLDEYDAAVKLLDRATNARQSSAIDAEVAKIMMNKQLATKYGTVTSPHFVIHYPDNVPQDFAQQMANVMESELKRLQKWVPTPNFRPTVVNMLWWRDFRSTYTGSDFILGFYQGKITVPLAGIPGFIPEAVAILTHELTHAMLAQATNEQAPSWFQEGLAQRTEMVPYKPNAFNMYEDNKLLSVSVLDAVLHGSPDPEMVGEAYVVAQTIIRYIEATYGSAGLAKMIAAYREGATTAEAIQRLSGLSVPDFDIRLRAWGRSGTKVFENKEMVSYESSGTEGVKWTRPGGGH